MRQHFGFEMRNFLNAYGASSLCPLVDETAEHHRTNLAAQIGASVPELAQKLASLPHGSSYRVVLSRPVGGALNPRADGLYDAFVKGPDGKIVAVARLSRVGPAFLSSATMLVGQAMLAQISRQLTALQQDVDLLVRLQLAEELGKVKAAIISLRTMHYYERHRDQVLLATVNSLKGAIGVAVQQASELIRAVPEPPASNVKRALWDTSPDTIKALGRARDAVTVVLLGLQALCEAEVLLNENGAAAKIMSTWLESISRDLDMKRCERLARMMPANGDEDRHELFWMKVTEVLAETGAYIHNLLTDEIPMKIGFECKSEDLLAHASVSKAEPEA